MSRQDVELFLHAVDMFNRRDLDGFLALAHDEIEIESRLAVMEGGYHGHEGARRWWANFLEVLPDYNLEIEELHDLGDVLLGRMRGEGHAAKSETPLVDWFWQPIRFQDAKCIWWRNCATEADALDAIGWKASTPTSADR